MALTNPSNPMTRQSSSRKTRSSSRPVPGREWNDTETRLLMERVQTFGEQWEVIAALFTPKRTMLDCSQRYYQFNLEAARKRAEAMSESLNMLRDGDADDEVKADVEADDVGRGRGLVRQRQTNEIEFNPPMRRVRKTYLEIDRSFQCSYCHKAYGTKCALRAHRKLKHPDATNAVSNSAATTTTTTTTHPPSSIHKPKSESPSPSPSPSQSQSPSQPQPPSKRNLGLSRNNAITISSPSPSPSPPVTVDDLSTVLPPTPTTTTKSQSQKKSSPFAQPPRSKVSKNGPKPTFPVVNSAATTHGKPSLSHDVKSLFSSFTKSLKDGNDTSGVTFDVKKIDVGIEVIGDDENFKISLTKLQNGVIHLDIESQSEIVRLVAPLNDLQIVARSLDECLVQRPTAQFQLILSKPPEVFMKGLQQDATFSKVNVVDTPSESMLNIIAQSLVYDFSMKFVDYAMLVENFNADPAVIPRLVLLSPIHTPLIQQPTRTESTSLLLPMMFQNSAMFPPTSQMPTPRSLQPGNPSSSPTRTSNANSGLLGYQELMHLNNSFE